MSKLKRFDVDEIERRKKLLVGARQVRSKDTEEHDKVVLSLIRKYKQITLKQIEKFLLEAAHKTLENEEKETLKKIATETFLINSLNRLEKKDKEIFSITAKEPVHGKIVKYYVDKEKLDQTKITISKGHMNSPYAFSISEDKIAIADKSNNTYSQQSKFSEPMIKLESTNEEEVLQLPKLFVQFYNLEPGTYHFDKISEKDAVILQKVKILKSADKEEPKINSKNILILEDHQGFAKQLIKRLERDGHHVTHVNNIEQFNKELDTNGKKYDVISLDNSIGSTQVAKTLSYEIRYKAPQAKIGIYSQQIKNYNDRKEFQNLDFDFIYSKDEDDVVTGFTEIGDELATWLKII